MKTEDSLKKLKRNKNTNKKKFEQEPVMEISQFAQREGNLVNDEDKNRNRKTKKKKRSSVDIANKVDVEMFEPPTIQANEAQKTIGGIKKSKRLKQNKMKNAESELEEYKLQKLRKKRRKNVERINEVEEYNEKDDAYEQQNESEPQDHIANSGGLNKADRRRNSKIGKSKKPGKVKKKSRSETNKISPDILPEKRGEDAQDEVYQMSSGDEDCSKGMKKWITQYHQSRPGLKVLQERIDDFIMAHEAQEEQARIEREAQAAEGGWTVVVHHKGRKKTTEAETGVAVGSVAQAAVLDKMARKKTNEVGVDFYRFQKREAHRNEIMMLQSKFEQDKKRIQQMRAARKFRPY